jgi:signal transduction histidine kinase
MTADLTTGVAFGVALLLGVLLGRSLAHRRLLRSVSDLADNAQDLARDGRRVRPVQSGIPELDRLGAALAKIAHDLGGQMTDAEEASDTLRFVLGAIPQGTVLFDVEDRLVYANPAAHQILGVVPQTLAGMTPFQLQGAVREAREGGSPVMRLVDHGRPARRLRGTAVPFQDERVLLVVVDVTERERLDSVRRDFAANASHELKTPVATIVAASEALQISLAKGDGSAEGFAARVEKSARQLDRLVADLLDLSRLEQETPDLIPSRLDDIVIEEVQRLGPRFDDAGVSLVVHRSETPVLASGRDIAAATRNLLDNAVRHTPRGGEVTVIVEPRGGEATLSVTDTGEGIPSRDLSRVFERFYRVDSARSRATGGTGLGLAIVKHVAERHGGEVSVESELGKGSTFTVALPLHDGDESGGN